MNIFFTVQADITLGGPTIELIIREFVNLNLLQVIEMANLLILYKEFLNNATCIKPNSISFRFNLVLYLLTSYSVSLK
jgi:hypothetical protein